MGYTAPSTVSTGDVLTATNFNNAVNSIIDLRSYQNRYASYRYTTGNVTLTGTSTWSTLTTISTAGDLTINASSGDVIEAGLHIMVGLAAVDMGFDVVTVVSGTATNSFGTAGAVPANYAAYQTSGWWAPGSSYQFITGSMPYTLAAGDVSGGQVTVRVRYAMAAATNRILYANTIQPFMWWVKNLGPVTT